MRLKLNIKKKRLDDARLISSMYCQLHAHDFERIDLDVHMYLEHNAGFDDRHMYLVHIADFDDRHDDLDKRDQRIVAKGFVEECLDSFHRLHTAAGCTEFDLMDSGMSREEKQRRLRRCH